MSDIGDVDFGNQLTLAQTDDCYCKITAPDDSVDSTENSYIIRTTYSCRAGTGGCGSGKILEQLGMLCGPSLGSTATLHILCLPKDPLSHTNRLCY